MGSVSGTSNVFKMGSVGFRTDSAVFINDVDVQGELVACATDDETLIICRPDFATSRYRA